MDARESGKLPSRLEALRRRFERWRGIGKPRSPIPDRLWVAAVKLASKHGLCRTARTLRVDYYSLKKRVEAASVTEHGRPTLAVGGQTLSAAGPEEGTPTTFVELPSPAHPSRECVLELESAAGAKMRVQVKGVAMPDLTALARSFWDHVP
jgi:hypothetical protein